MITLSKSQLTALLIAFANMYTSKKGSVTTFPLAKTILEVRTISLDGLRWFETNNEIFDLSGFINYFFGLWRGME